MTKEIKRFKQKDKTNIILYNQHGYPIKYKGYTVGELPNSFGYKEMFNGFDDDGDPIYKEGKSEWFNYKGLTWIINKEHWSKQL